MFKLNLPSNNKTFKFVRSNGWEGYELKEKVDSRTCDISFWKETIDRYKDAPITYCVTFRVVHKKKNKENFDIQTGDSSLKYLLWAKNKIVEFGKFLEDRGVKCKILIGGADNRRFNTYKLYLSKKLKCVESRSDGQRVLVYRGKV